MNSVFLSVMLVVAVLSTALAADPRGAAAAAVDGPRSVLMVAVTSAGSRDDQRVRATLEDAGFDVEIVADEAVTPEDALGKDVVLITATVAPARVGTTFTDSTVPVVNYEFQLHDDLALVGAGSGTKGESGSSRSIDVVDPGHPVAIAIGADGATDVFTRNSRTTFGVPEPGAEVVATQIGRPDRAVLFTYETGTPLADGTPAPARRAGVFPGAASDGFLSDAGQALLVSALEWAMGPAGPPGNLPPSVDVGPDLETTELTVTVSGQVSDDGLPEDSTVLTVWSGPDGVLFEEPTATETTVSLPGYGVYELTLTGDDGERTGSDSVIVVATDPNLIRLLLVTVNRTGSVDDRKVKAALERAGFAVDVVADEAASSVDPTRFDAVVITATASPARVRATFTGVEVPVVNYQYLLHDDLDLTGPGSANRATVGGSDSIHVVDPDHELMAGLAIAGPTKVFTRRSRATFGVPSSDGRVVATVLNRADRATLFTYDRGADLISGAPAPARRVGLFPSTASDGFISPAGYDLLIAAIRWAATDDVDPAAAATVSPTSGRAPLTISADGSASTDDETIASYLWDFGDGTQSSEMLAEHTYSTGGSYPVRLTVTDMAGNADTVEVTTVEVASARPAIETGEPRFDRAMIDNTVAGADAIVAIDVDGAAGIDLLADGPEAGPVLYRRDPTTGFLAREAVDAGLADAHPVGSVDLDDDGDHDVLSIDDDAGGIAWYENDGTGGFTARMIDDGSSDPASVDARSMVAVDVDRDEDLDLVVAAGRSETENDPASGAVVWFENDGAQGWTARVIDSAALDAVAAQAFDADGDGDLDLAVATGLVGTDSVALYLNDGTQTFIKQPLAEETAGGAASMALADVDGNDLVDIVIGGQPGSVDQSLTWFRNDGDGGFTGVAVEPGGGDDQPGQQQTEEQTGPVIVAVADLDGNGVGDIVAADRTGNTVAWYRHSGAGFARSTVSDQVSGAGMVAPLDNDDDGDLDLSSIGGDGTTVSVHSNIRRHPLDVEQDQTVVIDATLLNTVDPDNTSDELVYTVAEAPIGGTLARDGVALRSNQTFTQADVDAGLLSYTAGPEAWIDRFRFTVSDGDTSIAGRFAITISEPEPEPEPDTPIGPYGPDYDAHLAMIRAQTGRNTLHDDSPFRDVAQRQLDVSDGSPLLGARSDYLTGINNNPEFSFPVRGGGQFRVACEFSHFAYDDPILNPDQPGRSHLHMMFGNTDVNAFSSYESLRDSGSSTCNGQELNRSGYWAPAMIDGDGNVRIPERVVVYYKAAGTGTGKTQPFRPGMANIAPAPLSVPEVPTFDGGEGAEVNYKCSNNASAYQFADGVDEIPNCDGDFWFDTYGAPYPATRTVLEMEIKFWHCFDPTGAVDDWQQWKPSGPTRGSWFYGNCDGRGGQSTGAPPLDDKEFYPAVVYYVNYVVEPGDDTSDWFLSSDVDPLSLTSDDPEVEPVPSLLGLRGEMHHADWWGAWHPEINWEFLDRCVNYYRWPADSGCGFGYLSDGGPNSANPFDGRALKFRPQYDQVGDGSTYKMPLGSLFSELCEPLGPAHTYTVPESGAYCLTDGEGHGGEGHDGEGHDGERLLRP